MCGAILRSSSLAPHSPLRRWSRSVTGSRCSAGSPPLASSHDRAVKRSRARIAKPSPTARRTTEWRTSTHGAGHSRPARGSGCIRCSLPHSFCTRSSRPCTRTPPHGAERRSHSARAGSACGQARRPVAWRGVMACALENAPRKPHPTCGGAMETWRDRAQRRSQTNHAAQTTNATRVKRSGWSTHSAIASLSTASPFVLRPSLFSSCDDRFQTGEDSTNAQRSNSRCHAPSLTGAACLLLCLCAAQVEVALMMDRCSAHVRLWNELPLRSSMRGGDTTGSAE